MPDAFNVIVNVPPAPVIEPPPVKSEKHTRVSVDTRTDVARWTMDAYRNVAVNDVHDGLVVAENVAVVTPDERLLPTNVVPPVV